jgi:hypothetical protein
MASASHPERSRSGFWDFGIDVEVKPPPSDEVVDVREWIAGLATLPSARTVALVD